MPRYEDQLINEPPSEEPVRIAGYNMRRKQRIPAYEVSSSSTPPGSSCSDSEGSQEPAAVPPRRGRPPKKKFRAARQGDAPPPQLAGRKDKEEATFKENFSSVGGLEEQLRVLEESVVFPLVHPWMFGSLGAAGRAAAPRGILLTGASGCGKTLCVRALVGSLHQQGVKVSLYLRKGADALSKYVGEGEKKLKEVFEEAKANQPAIIFFDELDGLAPVRSSESSNVHHTSLVTTLLALMDGIEHRGEQVIVIGATNRPEALDPALRRPGRFDKELKFEPPRTPAQRKAILHACLRKWPEKNKPKENVIEWIAKNTPNFTGADLNALVNGAVMTAIRRTFGGFYGSQHNPSGTQPQGVKVRSSDFVLAIKEINPNRALDLGSDATSQIHMPTSPLLSGLFSAEIAALVQSISSAIGIPSGDAVPDYFRHNAIYVEVPEQHQYFPTVFRNAVLPSVIAHFTGNMNALGISAFTEELGTSAPAAAALVQSAIRLSPALVVVDDNVFDDAVVDTTVQRAVADKMRAVLLPGNRVFGVFLGRASRKIGLANVSFVPKLDAGSLKRRVEELLLEHADLAIRQARAQSGVRGPAARDEDEREATELHEHFSQVLGKIIAKLTANPRFYKYLGELPEEGSEYYSKIERPRSLACMARHNEERRYLALDEFMADVDLIIRNSETLGGRSVPREFREAVQTLLKKIDRKLVTNLDVARERLARRVQEEYEDVTSDGSEEEKEVEIPASLRRLIKEKANEMETNYNDWDKLANEVVAAVRYIQAKAKDFR